MDRGAGGANAACTLKCLYGCVCVLGKGGKHASVCLCVLLCGIHAVKHTPCRALLVLGRCLMLTVRHFFRGL